MFLQFMCSVYIFHIKVNTDFEARAGYTCGEHYPQHFSRRLSMFGMLCQAHLNCLIKLCYSEHSALLVQQLLELCCLLVMSP